ncbi:MAG: hypothetical protein HKM00_02820 [Gallionella sp.]|jgi:hypothetical protein|nr:hypothetical protein [Gallionella sp.]
MATQSIANLKSTAQALMEQSPAGFKTLTTYCAVLDFIHQNIWEGACHGSSSVLATLLSVQGVQPTLCLGEVFHSNVYFDHSWVEVHGEVLDAAISRTLIHGFAFPPVFRGRDLSTKNATALEYGKPSGQGYDVHANWIRNVTVFDYMALFPEHPDGLFGIAKIIGKAINLRVTLPSLQEHARSLTWTERP